VQCHKMSVNGDVVCSVSWISMADMLNTHFTKCPYCKVTVVTDVLEIFSKVQQDLHQMCCYVWHTLVCYTFIKIMLVSCHLWQDTYLVYMCQKSLNFIDAFKCYRQK